MGGLFALSPHFYLFRPRLDNALSKTSESPEYLPDRSTDGRRDHLARAVRIRVRRPLRTDTAGY